MKISKDIATGTIIGTIGFFGSGMREFGIIPRSAWATGFTIFSSTFLYRHPHFNPGNIPQNHYAVVLGSLLPLGMGFLLQYGLDLPDYGVNTTIAFLTFIANVVVTAVNKEEGHYVELRDMEHPERQYLVNDPPIINPAHQNALEKVSYNMFQL